MKNLLSISICFLFVITCNAQSIEKKTEKERVESDHMQIEKSMQESNQLTNEMQLGEESIKNSVVIYNSSNQKLSVLIFESSSKNDTVKIMSNEVWISPLYSNNPSIKIQTKNQGVTYTLERGCKYMIFWNRKSKYWDMKKTN